MKVKARLRWLIPLQKDGSSPGGGRVIRPAKFDHQSDDWTRNAWSLVVESETRPDDLGVQDVRVHFLMPNAPSDWLTRGRKFTLQEGLMPLAEGEVL